jgi:translocation and assembly module TamB
MTNLPEPENRSNHGPEPRPDSPAPKRSLWFRRMRQIGIPVAITLVAGAVGGGWYGWVFVHEKLAPLVEKTLSQMLKRPVQLGKVKRFTLNSLRFGETAIPATPTDPDRVSIETVDVAFDPLQFLLARKLKLDVTLNTPEIYLEQGQNGIWVETEIQELEETGPIKTELQEIRFKNGTAVLLAAAETPGAKQIPVTLSELQGNAQFFDKNRRIAYELDGESGEGGKLRLMGETLRLQSVSGKESQAGTESPQAKPEAFPPEQSSPRLQTKLQIRAQDMPVIELDRLLKLPVSLQAGRADGTLTVELNPEGTQPDLYGTAKFREVTLAIAQFPQTFTGTSGGLQFQGKQLRLDQVNALFGKIPLQANGTINTQKDAETGFNLTAQVKPVSLPNLLQSLKVQFPYATTGEVQAALQVTGPLDKPILTGFARNTKPGRVDRVDLNQYNARFRLDGTARQLRILGFQATPAAGGEVTGSGQILFSKNPAQLALDFTATNVPGDAIARTYNDGKPLPITVGRVNARTQITGLATNPRIAVRWQAPEATYAGRGELLIANAVTTFQNTTFSVAGGQVEATGRAVAGRWQAAIVGSDILLNRFSPELRGLLSGQLNLAGTLESLRPEDIRAQGQVQFSQGIAIVRRPITAQVQWDGRQVIVQRATSPGLSADGTILARLEGAGAPAITSLNLNLRASNYDLQAFQIPLPQAVANIPYSGRTDFVGQLTGTPTNPNVVGALTLRDFTVNGVPFEETLRGNLQAYRGLNLNVSGQRDQIAVTLDADYTPVAFDIQRGMVIARGRTQDGLLIVEAQNFPVAFLSPPGTAILFPIAGQLNGTVALNLKQGSASGQLAIAQPALGSYQADQFGGRIIFANGVATLSGADLRRGNSVFQINASANLFASDPQLKAQLRVSQGQIQDVLQLLQVFDLQDFARGLRNPVYGRAANLQTVPIELSNTPLFNQLRRLSEIETLLAQLQAEREETPLPDLSELQGNFSGEVSVVASMQTGINANFNFQGQDWQWGKTYSAKQVVAIGSFENGVLTLLPLRLQSDQSFLSLSGQLGGQNQSGQLRIEKVPIEQVTELLDLPIDVAGQLNATATISGRLDNPQAVGSLQLTNGVLNGTDVEQAQGSFRYADARLEFGSQVVISGPQPIRIVGSLPVELPFAAVEPESDRINLDINVRNEGLALLNVFTQQVAWVDGEGLVDLNVQGTLKQPVAKGIIQIQKATLQARALPEPLTDVNGIITFDFDRARVENLRGQFSQGNVAASGVLPLFEPLKSGDRDQEQLLNVTLDKLRIRLKGLYQGGVDGNVLVAGTLLNPILGGVIRLSNGQVLLTEADPSTPGNSTQEETADGLEFKDLRLELGNAVQITRQPILNFVATGDLTLNGDYNDLRPNGTIRLRSGQVNLFTTQFTLERGYSHTAEFLPNQGLDPNLDIQLIASVPEVTRTRLPSATLPSEILDATTPAGSLGALQTVRVRAEVQGPASRLFDNLELSSSPARSPSEIVALIGGSFVETLGRGDSILGIANLAGSALLTNVQGFIGNALGLSEFRLFPTLTREDPEADSRGGSTLGLAAEAALDITPSLSVSVLRILTSSQPTQFGLRYRINDQILLRGSTDFSGDSRATVEYEARF